jgi:hypothetical protein
MSRITAKVYNIAISLVHGRVRLASTTPPEATRDF